MSTWLDKAACAGLPPADADRLFFPDDPTDPEATAAAKTLCAGCPVRQACLDAAASTAATDGVWGGLTTEERAAAGIPVRGTRVRTSSTHGTRHRWNKGCRCDECVEAKRTYTRRQMRRWRRGIAPDPQVVLPTYQGKGA